MKRVLLSLLLVAGLAIPAASAFGSPGVPDAGSVWSKIIDTVTALIPWFDAPELTGPDLDKMGYDTDPNGATPPADDLDGMGYDTDPNG